MDSSLKRILIPAIAAIISTGVLRILRRFQQEGIEMPFPHRTVYIREEKDDIEHL